MLLAVMFLLALLMISLTVALPKIAKEIQRDRELETMQRGKQYSRAVKMYYKKFGRYPPNIDALVKTSEIRYLRKKYKDPTTGKEEWKPIMLGQNKAPTAMGFFGQPIAGGGMAMAGVGPNGGNAIPGAAPIVGANSTTAGGAADPNSGSNSADPNNPAASATGSTDPNNPTAGSTNPTGPSFGGAGIIGFSPMSPKQSILVYKKKSHYNEWEFVYDPLADMMTIPGGGNAPGVPLQPGAPGAPGGGPPPVVQPPMPTTPVNDPIQPPQ